MQINVFLSQLLSLGVLGQQQNVGYDNSARKGNRFVSDLVSLFPRWQKTAEYNVRIFFFFFAHQTGSIAAGFKQRQNNMAGNTL